MIGIVFLVKIGEKGILKVIIRVFLIATLVLGAFVWGQNRGINMGVEEALKLFPVCRQWQV